jgi:monoamine oxidase
VPARATRTAGGGLRVAARNWSRAPLAQGSYPSQHPGYFTTIAGWEGASVDNLHFAGDQADSFYSWQGYMEGAVTSGIDAADTIWRRVR